jgi:hypothetical protein
LVVAPPRGALIRTARGWVPDIVTVAWAAVFRAPGGLYIKPGSTARAANALEQSSTTIHSNKILKTKN